MERKALQTVPGHESILELWVRRCLEALGNETPSRMLTRIQKQLLTCSTKCHVGVFSSKDRFTLQVSCNYFLGDSDLLSLTTIKLSYKKLSLGQIYMAMFCFFSQNSTKPNIQVQEFPHFCLVLPPTPQFCLNLTLLRLFFFLLEQGLSSIAGNSLCEFSIFCVSAIEKNKLFSQYMAEMTLLGCPSCLCWMSF